MASSNSKKKKVLLIHTGGTFGMQRGAPHVALAKTSDYLETLFAKVPELKHIAQIELKILCNVDSSDVDPTIWKHLAETIVKHWDSHDGFVVIHGTDTMAYSASALSFFLKGLSKPVVFTGSQRPLAELRSDARANLIDSVELATSGIPEVMICFDSKVHRGTRASKFSNEHLHAFQSYNVEPIGGFGVHFTCVPGLLPSSKKALSKKPTADTRVDARIVSLEAAPGASLSKSLIDAIVSDYQGIVLRAFGTGNLPLANKSWVTLCERAQAKKIPIVMATHCPSGRVSLETYANGRKYHELGVISSQDMGFEALTVKLMIMLGRKIEFKKRHEFFATPLAHECFPQPREALP